MKIVIKHTFTEVECKTRGKILGLQTTIDCMLPTHPLVNIIRYVRDEMGISLKLAKHIVSTRKNTGQWVAPLVLVTPDYEWDEIELSVVGGGHSFDEVEQRIYMRDFTLPSGWGTEQSFRIVRKK